MTDEEITKRFEEPFTDSIMDMINGCFTNYIFYQREDSGPYDPITGMRIAPAGYICFCTRCRREFRASFKQMCSDGVTKKHHDTAQCPMCKRTGMLWHNNRGKKSLSERQLIVVFRKIDYTHVIAQGYYAYKGYCGDPKNRDLNSTYSADDWHPDPEIEMIENTRYRFEPGVAKMWWKGFNAWRNGPTWYEQQCISEPFRAGFYGYGNYLLIGREEVLGGSFMQYCADDIYAIAPGNLQRLMSYYAYYAQYPICEMLLKLGLYDIVTDAVDARKQHKRYLNWEAQKPMEFFKGLTHQEFTEIVKSKPKYKEYEFYIRAKKAAGLTYKESQQIMRDYYNYPDQALDIMQRYGISAARLENYLKRQAEYSGASSTSHIFIIYRDYLNMAKQLGYDLAVDRVKMPKMLLEAHDTVTHILNAMQRAEEKEMMKKLTKKRIKQYSFEYGELMIVVPETMQDIINEGKALAHCVGGYAERHAKGKTTILFLRHKKAPSIPYFTIEVNRGYDGKHPLHIVQCHGFANERGTTKPAEVVEFEKEFAAFIRNPKKYKKDHKQEEIA